MGEIAIRLVAHADAFHHGARAKIGLGDDGMDLRQAQRPGVVQGGAGGFRRIALAPMGARQPPADLDAGTNG
jgi:hypothetical protein